MATTLDTPDSAIQLDDETRAAFSPVTFLTRTVVPVAMVLATLVAMVRVAAAPLSNPDTYFHLRFGSEFLHHWSLRHPGHVTTWATADWVPTQWLPQELMARLEESFGLAGVAWYAGFQFVAVTLALYLAARRWADRVVAAPLLIVALLACSPGFSMRPQVLSYLGAALTVALWMSVRYGTGRVLWRAAATVPLIWLWAMCHGMWPLGVIISATAVAALVLDGSARGVRAVQLAAAPVAAGLAAGILTPVGPALLPAVLLVNSRGQYFSEWAPPDFTAPNCLALLLMLAVTVLLMVRRGSDWFMIAMVGLSAGFAVYSGRTVPVAACMLVPLGARTIQGLLGDSQRLRRVERSLAFAAAAASLVILAAIVPSTSDQPPPQPKWVDPALTSLPGGTRILNDESFGGFLMWRYPDLDFMFSGYGDIYTTKELKAMSEINDVKPGWDDKVRAARPAYALLDPDTALAYALTHGQGWTVVHHDEDVELLAPPAGWMDQS